MRNAILLAMFLLISRAAANWGGYAEGSLGIGDLKGLDQVEMVSESLSIVLHKQYADVEVKYSLQNTAGPVEVKAGFPCVPCKKCSYSRDTAKQPVLDIFDYSISADGKVLEHGLIEGKNEKWFKLSGTALDMFSMEPPDSNSDSTLTGLKIYWMVSKLNFEKNQNREVTISYKVNYQSGGSGFSEITDFDSEILRYFLHTGASWKGPIKRGFVRIHNISKDVDRIRLMPAKMFTRSGDDFTWKFSNLEPTLKDNIVIDFNNAYTSPYDFSGGVDKKLESWYVFEDTNYNFDFHGYSVKTSSTLLNKTEYQETNVSDFDEKTAWVEGKKGPGTGESLTLVLDKPADIYAVGILAGYYKSKDVYFNNDRVAKIRITVNDKKSMDYRLYDDYNELGAKEHRAYQFLTLPASDTQVKTLRLTILDVYKGTKYDDACISEILLRKKLSKKPEIQGAR